jgi:hypothetical protein
VTDRPIDVWRRKLEFLQAEEARASDADQRFTIRERIEEAKRRIAELEGNSPSEDRTQATRPPSSDPPPPSSPPGVRQAGTDHKFDVFLSHNSKDKSVVRDLKERLRGYQSPLGAPIKAWLDEDELQPGLPWQDLLERGIKNSSSAAVLIGNDGLGPWEDEEMRGALQLAVQDKRPVIPVLLPGAPSKPELPMFLRNRTWVDLRNGLTVEGLEKLVWGITGKKPQRLLSTKQPTTTLSLDAILLAYSEARLAQWNEAWTNPEDPDRLLYYVPPHYSVVKSKVRDAKATDRRSSKSGPPAEEPLADASTERVPGATEEETLINLLLTSDRLCVSEGPGAGKSIFTRRVQAFLSSPTGRRALLDGKPALAVRWEEWDGSWPDDFHVSLARELEPHCDQADKQTQSRASAEAALADGRVTLILDALDQVGTEERIRHLSDFLTESKRRGWRLRVVMTGRPFAVEQRMATLLRDPGWRFASIENFDLLQQYQYLYGPEPSPAVGDSQSEAWTTRSLPDGEIQRLVTTADLSDNDESEREHRIRTSLQGLFPNYEDVSDLIGNPAVLGMIRGLAEENELDTFERRGDLYAKTSEVMMRRAAARVGEAADVLSIERTEAVLAAIACQMMVQDPNSYRLDGGRNVARLREHAARRIEGGISDDQWHRVERLTGLTNRSLLYGASDDVLAWHHKGMMEFYCGLHLARNSQPGWCVEQTDSRGQSWPACGDAEIRRAAADPQWQWAFRFAIEMHEQVRDAERLLASVSALFQPADTKAGHPRPTEQMYRAWSLLEALPPHEWPDSRPPALLRDGQRIIEQYRSQWQVLCEKTDDPQADIARALLNAFTPCPPDEFIAACGNKKDPYTFQMGATATEDAYEWEQPQHSVRVSPFQMMSVPVTRQQYALFDPNHEREHHEELAKRSPQPECPAIDVSWYDAWCFARWLGANYRLPTEAEWEYACRAGTTTEYSFGDDEKLLAEHGWFDENSGGQMQPVGAKKPNRWGLCDMHGNVWEWCADWFDIHYYAKSPPDDPTGPLGGSYRVRRGGCWRFSARYCRSAYRDGSTPANRDYNLGFRVALVPSSQDRRGGASSGGP